MNVKDGRAGNRKKHPSRQAHPSGDAPVLYIHPAKQGVAYQQKENTGRPYHLMPVGIAGLVNLLVKNGIGVHGIDYPLERQLNPAFDLKRWLRAQPGARVVLIDLHWYEHSFGAIDTAKACREALPEVWTVLGGLTASGFAGEILAQFPEVDFIIRGDAEKPLLELLPQLIRLKNHSFDGLQLEQVANLSYRKDGGVVENELAYCATSEDLDRLNFASLDFLEHKKEYHVFEYLVTDLKAARQSLQTKPFLGRWITTARGCRHDCSYCGGGKNAHAVLSGRDGIICRSPQKVVDDLARLKDDKVIQASLTYDISEIGEDYWRMFFALLRRSGIRMGIYNEFFQLPKAALIEEFAQSVDMSQSCVALSPLSGSERVRRLNGKLFTNDELFNILGVLNSYNFYTIVYFSLNLPGETEEVFKETLDLASEIYSYYPTSLLKILNTSHTLDPVSPMALHPEKYGIEVSMSSFEDYYQYCRSTQQSQPEARSELSRGFRLSDQQARTLEKMADAWDKQRQGKEKSWWPIPPGW